MDWIPGDEILCRLRQEYKLALRYEVKLPGLDTGGQDFSRLRQEYKLALQHEVKLYQDGLDALEFKWLQWTSLVSAVFVLLLLLSHFCHKLYMGAYTKSESVCGRRNEEEGKS